MENPYASPETSAEDPPQPEEKYGGIGRLAFVAGLVGLVVLHIYLGGVSAAMEVANSDLQEIVSVAYPVGFLIGLFALTIFRLKNLGVSPWWSLGLLVPLLNVLISFRCLLCPTGYADTKKLDLAGKIFAGLILGYLVLAILLAFVDILL